MRTLVKATVRALGGAIVLVACNPTPNLQLPDEAPIETTCSAPADCAPDSGSDGATPAPVPPTCSDGIANGDETDLDCGGTCKPCDVAKACKVGADCASAVCAAGGSRSECQPPSSTDGVKNGTETAVDCGGIGNPKCADGQACAGSADCLHDICTEGLCVPPSPEDHLQNGEETDIDCGGPAAPRCADAKKCVLDGDCQSDVCKEEEGVLRCQVPSTTDLKKNGTETDVDCGGAIDNPRCLAGKSCLVGADCASGGCNYQLKCAAGRSCTARYGGDTCGAGGEGGLGAASWEDCCTSIPVTTSTGGTTFLDKYPVTAGRMRAFLTSVNYDVRGFVQQARGEGKIPVIPENYSGGKDGVHPVLDVAWDAYLPTSFDGNTDPTEIADCDQSTWDVKYSVCCENPEKPTAGGCPAGSTLGDDSRCHYWDPVGKQCPAGRDGIYNGMYTSAARHLGGTIFRANSQPFTGCFVGSPGTHSFRFPDGKQDGDTPEQGQDIYDTKTLNCVDYLVAQAFCVWDGGRLETFTEWQATWGANDKNPYSALTSTLPADPNDRCVPTSSCTTGAAQSTTDTQCNTGGEDPKTYKCVASKCCLNGGDFTYWGCRFPWATDASHPSCGLEWPATKSIEYADYKYSYEYPKSKGAGDYIVFMTAPGRTKGRGPLGHSDIAGTGFEITSSINYNASLFTARHRWTGNGSWEVHDLNKTYGGNTMLLNKYGKLGLRCARPTSFE